MRKFRSGLTIVELVVILSAASLVMAVTLPALQQSREAARQEVCKNNLVQIGHASLKYDVVNGQYPPYMGLPFNPSNAFEFFEHVLDYQLTYSTVQLL